MVKGWSNGGQGLVKSVVKCVKRVSQGIKVKGWSRSMVKGWLRKSKGVTKGWSMVNG